MHPMSDIHVLRFECSSEQLIQRDTCMMAGCDENFEFRSRECEVCMREVAGEARAGDRDRDL
jgi:hypothetical protein